MTTLNLANKKVNSATVNEISAFIRQNISYMDKDTLMFYVDVRGFIEMQLRKPASKRMNMAQILERSYNIDLYILKSGALSVSTEVI